jgi:hypothetical protein
MRVNLRARDRDRAGSSMVREKSVPQGPDESSPVRSAGLAFLKSYPSRTGRSTKCGQSLSRMRNQKPSVSIVPLTGRACFFASFPSTSYWATFTESLRDKASPYNPSP